MLQCAFEGSVQVTTVLLFSYIQVLSYINKVIQGYFSFGKTLCHPVL